MKKQPKEIRIEKEPRALEIFPNIPCVELGFNTPDNCFIGTLGLSILTFNSTALSVF